MKELTAGFEAVFHTKPAFTCFAPGRVNLIGEHTDYNGGYVLPCAIHLGIYGAAARREDRTFRFYSESFPEAGVLTYELLQESPGESWANYPVSVIRALAQFDCMPERGADFYFTADLPEGAGLSSSAALEVATGILLRQLYRLPLSQEKLAMVGKLAENRFIGVNCGIMDQFASAMGKKDHALLLNTETLACRYAPLGNTSLVIVNSGVKHSLAGSAYNDRRRECETACRLLDAPFLCALSPEEFAGRSEKISDETILRRARHVVTENSRTLHAAEALSQGNLAAFGKLMNESHASLRDDYEVSCKELDFLSDFARHYPGVYGARMTGGGFGGCTVNLMEQGREEAFAAAIKTAYRRQFGIIPAVYPVRVSDGARIL